MATINDIPLFRYLFNLDNRDLPNSIFIFWKNINNTIVEERILAIKEFSKLKNNCKHLVKFSKTFVDALDKSSYNFCQFHKKILKKLDGECGILQSPYFLKGSYVVYSIKNTSITLWIFQNNISNYISIPTYYIIASPNDEYDYHTHKVDVMCIPLLDNCYEFNLQDYIDMTLDYLCLREWADVEIKEIKTIIQKEVIKNKKKIIKKDEGLSYFTFDSKWYTELINDNDFKVSGHFRLQHYSNGKQKLIWINEYTKHGYHRQASIEKYKEGKIILD